MECLRILPPGDAYSHWEQYLSGRDMKVDVWHRKWGREDRHIIGAARLEES